VGRAGLQIRGSAWTGLAWCCPRKRPRAGRGDPGGARLKGRAAGWGATG
jgi:hypothetical protein